MPPLSAKKNRTLERAPINASVASDKSYAFISIYLESLYINLLENKVKNGTDAEMAKSTAMHVDKFMQELQRVFNRK